MNQSPNAIARTTPKEGVSLQTIENTKEQLDLLTKLVEGVLRKDEDYGHIPGTAGNKGTLLKPGAANITHAFNCHAEPFIDVGLVDPSIGKNGFVNYEVHVDVISNISGNVMARGYGNANSYETKYRYREQKRKCPECGKEAIIKGKEEYGGGWLCWKKQDGCGAKFPDGLPAIEDQPAGKVENDNPLDLANTLKKMAIKRAEVDAAMRLPGVARFFTQDLEDMQPSAPPAAAPARPAQASAPVSRPASGPRAPQPSGEAVEAECPIHHVRWNQSKDKTDYIHRNGENSDGKAVWCVRSKIQAAPVVVEARSRLVDAAKAMGATEAPDEDDIFPDDDEGAA